MYEDVARNLLRSAIAAMAAVDANATGKTAASLRVESDARGVRLYGSGVVATLVNGSKPWRNRRTVPRWFIQLIAAWARTRHIQAAPYFIARKIIRDGNARFRRTRPRLPLQQIANEAAAELAKVAVAEITKTITIPIR